MSEQTDHSKEVYPVPSFMRDKAYVKSMEEYKKLHKESLDDPDGFWGRVAKETVTWFKPWDKVADSNYGKTGADHHIRWFTGGKLNVSYNCLDRHLATRGDQVAIIWEGNDPNSSKKFTYRELHEQVCRFANVLKANDVKRGDRVTIYLPMIPELAVAMLACTRIGAIHSIVFGGFSAEALRDRIQDCQSKIVITCDGTYRGTKAIPQKDNADKAASQCPTVEKVIVVKHVGDQIACQFTKKCSWWHDEMAAVDANCPAEEMDAEDPLFILYTSGSTGKPKGVLHTTGGYLTYVAYTHKMIFDYHDGDIFWCTADIGWITGHSYIIYGPLANGAITVMFEGVPTYPDPGRFWAVVAKHKINIFYTAPTAIRSLMREGESWVKKNDRSTLRLLGSVGEPINPEAWIWYHQTVGDGKLPIVDTWWQTETGGILITPLPGAFDLKPGKATLPFFGVEPCIVDDKGNELQGPCEGKLCIKRSWPGQMRSVYGDPERFFNTYFIQFPGFYFTGDGAKRDEDGYYQITGRVDDVINVSGHRLGTAEVESACVSHPSVAETAVVGFPHDIKGQGIYAYITLKSGIEPSDALKKEIVAQVRKEIGPIATPDKIQWAPGLPKTRSGKIMRRILRKIAEGSTDKSGFGDISTLADPTVVDDLIKNKQ